MVVTIVVLLILAGVSISLVVDKNGIIQKSKDARREYGQAKANEQEQMDNAGDWIDEVVTGKKSNVVKSFKEAKTENSTIDGKKERNANNPTIPKNYIPIDTATSTWGDGSTAPSQDSVKHGLVIKDEKNNEWVWVPVPDVTVMCDTSNTTEYTLCGTSGETAVKTKLYSKSEIISGQTRTEPGKTSYREPDLVVGSNGTSYDVKDTYYKTILGENGTKEELAQLFVDEYKEMIESIKTYGGFYIGRYELSEAGVQKDRQPLSGTNWYNLYNACSSSKLQASDKVKTQMIWGCQWDVTMNWLISSGAKTSDEVNKNSSTWGNYSNYNTANNYTEGTAGYEKNAGSLQNTGSSENWKANNIYDLAGNVEEWTQEANNTSNRAIRGGYCFYNGSFHPASDRYNGNPDNSGYYGLRYSSNFNNKIIKREYKFKCVKSKEILIMHTFLCAGKKEK